MIEHFTKWVELVALPNKTSDLTARALLEGVLARFGAPAEVLTDVDRGQRGVPRASRRSANRPP